MTNISQVSITPMSISDLDEIKDILLTDFDNFWKYEIFKEELVNTNSKYLVLRYKNEIVSFGGIKIILDEANLMDIVTKKIFRHQGFAKQLLKELIVLSKENNCSTITLEVNENNLNAISLYKSFNFEVVRQKKKILSKWR